MKRIIVLAMVVVLCLVASAFSADNETDEEVKYEVTVHVVYNAVSATEAAKIADEIMHWHAKACKVDVGMKKVGHDNDLVWVSNGTISLPTD